MKVLYRPHRAIFTDAVEEIKEFPSVKEMFEWLVKEHHGYLSLDNIYISYYCYDVRIDWETFIITTRRYSDHEAIGFCTFKNEGETIVNN